MKVVTVLLKLIIPVPILQSQAQMVRLEEIILGMGGVYLVQKQLMVQIKPFGKVQKILYG